MYVERIIEARSRNHCCYEKSMNITGFECVPFVIQHAKCIHLIILPSVDCLALPYFSTLLHRRHDFGENEIVVHNAVCFDFV
jgi:hypothetical protein